jgi:hypothetical protein
MLQLLYRKTASGTCWIEGWVGHTTGLDAAAEIILLSLSRLRPQ